MLSEPQTRVIRRSPISHGWRTRPRPLFPIRLIRYCSFATELRSVPNFVKGLVDTRKCTISVNRSAACKQGILLCVERTLREGGMGAPRPQDPRACCCLSARSVARCVFGRDMHQACYPPADAHGQVRFQPAPVSKPHTGTGNLRDDAVFSQQLPTVWRRQRATATSLWSSSS